jgi:hypothetical protein
MCLLIKIAVVAALLAGATVIAISPPASQGRHEDAGVLQLSGLE